MSTHLILVTLRGAHLVDALRYKQAGSGFDSRKWHRNFSLTSSFRPYCRPGVDSASNWNEYQGHFFWGGEGKGGRCVRLTLPPSCADCLEILEPKPPGPLRACSGLYRNCFTIFQKQGEKICQRQDSAYWQAFVSMVMNLIQRLSVSLSIHLSCFWQLSPSSGNQTPFLRSCRWWLGERSPDMVGTGEIKYPGWTKTSTATRQFDIDLSRARRKPWPKTTCSSRLGVDAAGQLLAHH